MSVSSDESFTIGLIGFGAFGQLAAGHLAAHAPITVFDPVAPRIPPALAGRVTAGDAAAAARCDVVALAVPVQALGDAIRRIGPHLRPGAIVMDVGSVKMEPARVMAAELPDHVQIVGAHPLFGPQSAGAGLAGLKIALCPVRGRAAWRVGAFLRRRLGLRVLFTTPEEHDREAAVAQGLTHLVAKALLRMEPLPRRLTTTSFDLMARAAEMVRHDAANVFWAIEHGNPFAAEARARFLAQIQAQILAIAEEARVELETGREQ